jgi:hypothetical protein
MHKHYGAVIMLGAFGLLVLGIGISLAGSPISQKKIRLDEIRTTDFNNLKYDIENYYRNNSKLPTLLSELNRVDSISDPETKKSYEYKVTTPFSYELCTEFSTDSLEVAKSKGGGSRYGYTSYNNTNTNHKAGYDCISYTIPDYDRKTYTNNINLANNFQTIFFKKPNTGDTLCLNDTYPIEWDSANAYSQISFYLTKATGDKIQTKILTETSANNGTVQPNSIPNTKGVINWSVGKVEIPGIVSVGSSYYLEARTPETDSLSVFHKNISGTFVISNCVKPSPIN